MKLEITKAANKSLLFFITLTVFSSLTCAKSSESQLITYEQLKELAKTPEFRINVSAVADGIYAANAYLVVKGKQPFICPPSSAVLSASDFTNIMLKNSEPLDKISRATIAAFLLKGLIKTFPCN